MTSAASIMADAVSKEFSPYKDIVSLIIRSCNLQDSKSHPSSISFLRVFILRQYSSILILSPFLPSSPSLMRLRLCCTSCSISSSFRTASAPLLSPAVNSFIARSKRSEHWVVLSRVIIRAVSQREFSIFFCLSCNSMSSCAYSAYSSSSGSVTARSFFVFLMDFNNMLYSSLLPAKGTFFRST